MYSVHSHVVGRASQCLANCASTAAPESGTIGCLAPKPRLAHSAFSRSRAQMSVLRLTVVWHRDFAGGQPIAEALAAHFEGAEDEPNSSGLTIPVRVRCEGASPMRIRRRPACAANQTRTRRRNPGFFKRSGDEESSGSIETAILGQCARRVAEIAHFPSSFTLTQNATSLKVPPQVHRRSRRLVDRAGSVRSG